LLFDDSLAGGQTDTRARILAYSVQPAKNGKHRLQVLGSNADAIIGY